MLKLYIITIIMSLFFIFVTIFTVASKIKKNKFKSNSKNTFMELFSELLKLFIISIIPLLNLLFSVVALFNIDLVYNKCIEDMKKKGEK